MSLSLINIYTTFLKPVKTFYSRFNVHVLPSDYISYSKSKLEHTSECLFSLKRYTAISPRQWQPWTAVSSLLGFISIAQPSGRNRTKRVSIGQPSNGQKINRQPSKTDYFYRQPSNERPKINRQTSQISLNDRDRLTKWGHQLSEQAINTSSGNGGDVTTLIIHIVVIVENQ